MSNLSIGPQIVPQRQVTKNNQPSFWMRVIRDNGLKEALKILSEKNPQIAEKIEQGIKAHNSDSSMHMFHKILGDLKIKLEGGKLEIMSCRDKRAKVGEEIESLSLPNHVLNEEPKAFFKMTQSWVIEGILTHIRKTFIPHEIKL